MPNAVKAPQSSSPDVKAASPAATLRSVVIASYLLIAGGLLLVLILWRELLPGLLTGFSLAFARGLGEYGSVIFIAGNLPYKTEIAPLLVTIRLEEYDYNGAIAIAALLLAASFACLVAINAIPLLFAHERRRLRRGE